MPVYCKRCGYKDIPDGAESCPNCGAPIPKRIVPDPNKKKQFVPKTNPNVIPAGAEKSKTPMIIAIVAVLALGIGGGFFLGNRLGNNDVIEKTPVENETEEATEQYNGPSFGIGRVISDETSEERTALTAYMSDIASLHEKLQGIERAESGSHEHWYEDLDGRFGYGNYSGSTSVDDFWIKSDRYEIYGAYVGQEGKEAVTAFANNGWLLESDTDNIFKLSQNNMIAVITVNGENSVTQISVYRESEQTVNEEKNKEEKRDDEYFFPNSLDELLDESQLYGMSARELTLARNEVFARYGYTFRRQELQEYFNTKSWYKQNPNVNADTIESYVSKIGMQNMVMIREYQKAHGLTY